MQFKQWSRVLCVVSGMLITGLSVKAQEMTPTPLQIQLQTATPASEQGGVSDAATATWTPTNEAPVRLQALDIANVRILPNTDETQVGVIRNSEFYTVTGRYFDWYQLEFEGSPNGFGWVYGELVEVIGNVESVQTLDPYASAQGVNPIDSSGSSAPGGVIEGGVLSTATAQTGQSIIPSAVATVTNSALQPTYTYPAGLSRPQPTDPASIIPETSVTDSSSSSRSGDLPPIVPILIIGGIGLLGLALTSIRR